MAKRKPTRAKTPTKRVSKAEWLQCALDVLQEEGIQGVRIERLARDLGIAKAGFYWHFANRDELLSELLNFWEEAFTTVVTRNPELQTGEPSKQILRLMQLILEHGLANYDLAIRDWSMHDKSAAKVVKKVYKMRTEFVRSLFRQIGFRGQQLEMRTRLFVCYHSWEHAMFPDFPKAEKRKLLKLRHKFLVTK